MSQHVVARSNSSQTVCNNSAFVACHSMPSSIAVNTIPFPFLHGPSLSWHGIGLPRIDLRLRSVARVSLETSIRFQNDVHARAVWLIGAPGKRPVGDVVRLSPAASCFGERVLGWRLVNGVGNPRMPEGLDLGTVLCSPVVSLFVMFPVHLRGAVGALGVRVKVLVLVVHPSRPHCQRWINRLYEGIEGGLGRGQVRVRGSSSVMFS